MNAQHYDVLIIGAGLSGIGTACQVSAEFPDRTIAILERRERLGGTWDLFRYPGVRSDSDMLTLGYSFRPWEDLKVLADGESIRQYIADTAAAYGIEEKIHYGLKVVSADWSSAEQRWTVTAVDEAAGEFRFYTATYLVSASGYYSYDAGHSPEFAGVERFRGQVVHPQFWPETLDHTGKKVVVIGSGATAITLVPAMADTAEHVTMLQRSPSYVMSIPDFDKAAAVLRRFLSPETVYRLARKRNIAVQRWSYNASRRFPKAMRRLLLAQVRRRVGDAVDMRHFTPTYMPWDERLCAVPNSDLFRVLRAGRASVVTDEVDTFTESGLRLRSGEELEADIVVTATGLRMQTLGGMALSVDGEIQDLAAGMAYKGVLMQDVPNMVWVFGYINASWTLKSDLTGAYFCRLLRHMDEAGHTVFVPRDVAGVATDERIVDGLRSGYMQRGRHLMPRQGATEPWKVVMDYKHNRAELLDGPVDDGVLQFASRDRETVGV
jgi:cation diffusion facilitator CzcD-associated flavoprotein CzcO